MRPLSILGASSLSFPAAPPHKRVEEAFDALWAGKFRKIGRFIKLALAGAALAVKHAGLQSLPARRTGVFLGTGLGNLADLVPFVQSLYETGGIPSPIQFANSVGNSGAFYIAQAYALEGPVLAICQDEVSFEAAVTNAASLLHAGEIDLALVGGVDAFVPPLSDHLARLGHDPVTHGGLALGEGAGFWVLSSQEGQGLAQLLDASVGGVDPRAALTSQLAFGGARRLFLSDRLRPHQAALLDLLGPGAAPVASHSGTFPTEAAAAAADFVLSDAGGLFHSMSATREGLLGTLTVRKGQ